MHVMTKRGSQDNVVAYEHMCDTIADRDAIPVSQKTIGSVAIVLTGESGGMEVYIANSAHQWLLLNAAGSTTENEEEQQSSVSPS